MNIHLSNRSEAMNRDAVTALRSGQMVVVTEPDCAVVAFDAATATTEQLHFAIRHSSGLVLALMSSSLLDHLRIPDQQVLPGELSAVAFTVAVDAASGITTGISAHDRAHTLQVLADPSSNAEDVVRPGHVLPLRCLRPISRGHPLSLWDSILETLASSNGPHAVAGACHLVADSGELLTDVSGAQFAAAQELPVISSQDLEQHLTAKL